MTIRLDHGVTSAVASWIVEADLGDAPREAIDMAKAAIADCVGVALAGSRTKQAEIARAIALEMGGHQYAVLWGTPQRTSTTSAAFANGVAAHALDYDDTNHPLYGHPSCHLVPTVMALGEQGAASGRDLVIAYLVGFEIEVRLSRAVNNAHYVAGWHATSTLGTFGATAAASRLLGLSARQVTFALGIASSLASGVRVNFGSMTKPLHAGLAAKNGVLAALLAMRGYTAADDGLGGQFGFLDLFRGAGEPRLSELDPARFGHPWEITLPFGLAIKQFPACGATHPAIEAALLLRERYELKPPEIRSIRVGTNAMSTRILVYPSPRTGLEGKFSMEYCVGTALNSGHPGLDQFDDAAVLDPTTQDLMSRTTVYEDPRVADSTEFAAVVSVELMDGRRFEQQVDLAKGKVARPLSTEEARAKFMDCAVRAVSSETADKLLGDLRQLDAMPSLDRIIAGLTI